MDDTWPDKLSILCAIPIDTHLERQKDWAIDFGTKALSLEVDAEQVSGFFDAECTCDALGLATPAEPAEPDSQ